MEQLPPGILETMEAREARAREIAKQEELARLGREKANLVKRIHESLLSALLVGGRVAMGSVPADAALHGADSFAFGLLVFR